MNTNWKEGKVEKIRAFYRQTIIILEYSPTLVSHVSSKQAHAGKHIHTKITQNIIIKQL